MNLEKEKSPPNNQPGQRFPLTFNMTKTLFALFLVAVILSSSLYLLSSNQASKEKDATQTQDTAKRPTTLPSTTPSLSPTPAAADVPEVSDFYQGSEISISDSETTLEDTENSLETLDEVDLEGAPEIDLEL